MGHDLIFGVVAKRRWKDRVTHSPDVLKKSVTVAADCLARSKAAAVSKQCRWGDESLWVFLVIITYEINISC